MIVILPEATHTPARPGKKIEIKSFRAASLICRDYIERNQLGGNNWKGGQIYEGTHLVAEVAHNGTVWSRDGWEIEI